MTVSVQTTFTASIANGVTTVFPYGFKVTDAEDLAVTVDGVLQTSGYTVSGVGEDAGGDVTFSVAPANGAKIVRYLAPVLNRPTDYQQFGDWLAQVVNLDFDRLWLAIQTFQQNDVRALKLPIDTSVDQTLLEDAAGRSFKVVGFDAGGNVTLFGAVDNTLLAAQLASTESGKGAALVGDDDGAGGSLWVNVKGFIAWVVSRFSDVIHAERFAAVGDGVTDDTTALQNAFNAAIGKVLILGPQRTYKFTSLTIPAGVTMISCGSVFRRAAASASWAITINGDFIADWLIYSSPGSVAATDLGVRIAGSNVSIDMLSSSVSDVDYGANALRIEGAAQLVNINIAKVKTKNWKSHIQVFNVDDAILGDVDIESYVTGLYLRDVSNSKFAGGHIRTMSPSGAGTAGQNGILVESTLASGSTHDVHFADFVIENAPEHGVRFGGQLSITDIWMDRIKTRNTGAAGAGATGGTGIKILGASSVAGQKHKRFHLTDCKVQDVSVTGNGQGNFCGFILAVCEDVHLSNCNVGIVNQTESCWYGVDIISAERVTISNPIINKSKTAYIRFNADDPGVYPGFVTPVKDIQIIGGQLRNLNNTYGLYFVGLKGDFSEISVDGTVIYGGGPAAVVRADAPTTGSYGDIQINAIHRDPVDTTSGPALQCGNRFRYHWTGPYYGTFSAQGLDGSVFVDTTAGEYKLRKAGAWVNL